MSEAQFSLDGHTIKIKSLVDTYTTRPVCVNACCKLCKH